MSDGPGSMAACLAESIMYGLPDGLPTSISGSAKALFDSIDLDGSGDLDWEELETAKYQLEDILWGLSEDWGLIPSKRSLAAPICPTAAKRQELELPPSRSFAFERGCLLNNRGVFCISGCH